MLPSYEETLASLYAVEAKKGMDFRLERLDPVLDALGRPERAFGAVVHVAGTNGKGSTAAMIESALRAGGWRTGLYTSPHLVSLRERIRTAGVPVSRDGVVRSVAVVRDAMRAAGLELTFFEIVTLAAFVEFRERGVDVAVLEAGLGGRLDATNVARGDVAVLTTVGMDHAEYLGDTLAKIAAEKAAIIKPGAVAVTGALPAEAEPVVAARVREVGATRLAWGRDFGPFEPLAAAQANAERAGVAAREQEGVCEPAAGRDQGLGRIPGHVPGLVGERVGHGSDGRAGAIAIDRGETDDATVLRGDHQLHNAALAAAAVDALAPRFPVEVAARDRGILAARWPGRLEVLPRRGGQGPLVLDAAHNVDGARALAGALDRVAPARPRVLVFAAMADKEWRDMLAVLAPRFDRVHATTLPMPRALAAERLLEAVPAAVATADPVQALALAERDAAAHGSVVVAGSIFLLGHLYRAAGGARLEDDLVD